MQARLCVMQMCDNVYRVKPLSQMLQLCPNLVVMDAGTCVHAQDVVPSDPCRHSGAVAAVAVPLCIAV